MTAESLLLQQFELHMRKRYKEKNTVNFEGGFQFKAYAQAELI